MLRYIMILNIFAAFSAAVNPGPRYPATKGEVWPKPQHQEKTNNSLIFDPRHLKIKVVGKNCTLLTSVIARYSHIFAVQSQRTQRVHSRKRSRLAELHVDLTGPCEHYPYYGMEETYNLTIASTSTLSSPSIWGIMRGFQTISHLVYLSDDYNKLLIGETEINDYPHYSHRGLMFDTSRHYISLQNILLTLDAMEMNKMNVFHWHIVDDQSFPYQSQKFPELSEHGAYFPTMIYSKADIMLVVKYARERGIRVVPEFDVPGHTRSWGESHPEILTQCFVEDKPAGLGPMNPISNDTYQLLEELFLEARAWFPEKYFHVGGDEVDFSCWQSNPTIKDYMTKHNKTTKDLYALFILRLFQLLGNRSQPIVWEEVFDDNVPLSADIPVQIWKEGQAEPQLNKVLEAGHKVLFSSLYYLDHLASGGDWEKYYVDPLLLVHNTSLAGNIIGGEACMWGEVVDDRNVINRVWPRASAVAEALWSSKLDLAKAKNRLEEHTCRMVSRSIAAQPPNGPGFCVV